MRLILFLFVLFVLSCSPATRSTKFQSYEPTSQSQDIKIMRTKIPVCDYEEVGIVNARKRNVFVSMEEVIESLKDEARKMGGDALIGLSEDNQIVMVTEHGVVARKTVLTGTVIRFTDRGCMQ